MTWLRKMVPPMEKDRILSTDVEAIAAKLKTGDLEQTMRKEFSK